MLNWMILPIKRYAEFTGRSRRMEYWSFSLLNLVVFGVLIGMRFATGNFQEFMASAGGGNPFAVYGFMFGGVGILAGLWWLAMLVPSIALNVRRLHDRDMSGWWYLGVFIGSLIPLIGVVVGLAYLVLMFLPGTPGPNRFGPDPKDPSAGAEVFS